MSVWEGLSVPFLVPVVKFLFPQTIIMSHSSYRGEYHASCTMNAPKNNTTGVMWSRNGLPFRNTWDPPVFIGVRVTRSLVFCEFRCRSLFVLYRFSFGHGIFCSSSIYGFWLLLNVSSDFSCSFRKWTGECEKGYILSATPNYQ